MDNITHSLAGSLIATGVVHLRSGSSPEARMQPPSYLATAAVITGIVGANLPDIDVPWNALMEAAGRQDAIGSMLQHRGYTHSLLAGVIWVLLLWAAGRWWLARRTPSDAPRDTHSHQRATLLLVAALTVLSHVTLDFTNDYGVHPLSPFTNRWFFGDTVFIVEPWLWVLSAAALMRCTARRAVRIALGVLVMLAVGLCWVVPQVSTVPAILVTLGAVAAITYVMRTTPARAALFGIGGWFGVTAAFACGTAAVRVQVRDGMTDLAANDTAAATGGEALALRDVIVSPYPANPLCARVVTVASGPSRYRLATAWAAAVPQLVSADWCARAVDADSSPGAQHVRMHRISHSGTPGVHWGWMWGAGRDELLQLARENCQVAGWLQFARAPFWTRGRSGSILVGDMRYDRDRGVNVALFTIPVTPPTCPEAAWLPPRSDVWPELQHLPARRRANGRAR